MTTSDLHKCFFVAHPAGLLMTCWSVVVAVMWSAVVCCPTGTFLGGSTVTALNRNQTTIKTQSAFCRWVMLFILFSFGLSVCVWVSENSCQAFQASLTYLLRCIKKKIFWRFEDLSGSDRIFFPMISAGIWASDESQKKTFPVRWTQIFSPMVC